MTIEQLEVALDEALADFHRLTALIDRGQTSHEDEELVSAFDAACGLVMQLQDELVDAVRELAA
jgi:hypothetical protein